MRQAIKRWLAILLGEHKVQKTKESTLETATWRGETYILKFTRHQPATVDPEQTQLEEE